MNCVVLAEQSSEAWRARVQARSCKFPTRYQTCCAVRTDFPSFVWYGTRGKLAPNNASRLASGPKYSQDGATNVAQSFCGFPAQPPRTADTRIAATLSRMVWHHQGLQKGL